jgi:hypothetical protein
VIGGHSRFSERLHVCANRVLGTTQTISTDVARFGVLIVQSTDFAPVVATSDTL